MKRPKVKLAAGLVALTALAAACGGGTDSDVNTNIPETAGALSPGETELSTTEVQTGLEKSIAAEMGVPSTDMHCQFDFGNPDGDGYDLYACTRDYSNANSKVFAVMYDPAARLWYANLDGRDYSGSLPNN